MANTKGAGPMSVRETATPLKVIQLPSLTSLRFIAALAVFALHASQRLPEGDLKHSLDPLLSQGLVGVSFFFVLSGFVMVWSHRPTDTARQFYRRRFARIAPAYWVALIIGIPLQFATLNTPSVRIAIDNLPSVVGLQSWVPVQSVYYAGTGVGWSLSTEAFFYLVFPALLLPLNRAWGRRVLVTVAVAMIIIVPFTLHPITENSLGYWAIYVFPVQRLAEFTCGAVLAMVMRSGRRFPIRPLPAILFVILTYLLAGIAPLWAQPVMITVVPFVILVGAVAQADLDHRPSLLRSRGLITLGDWSYSFYLLHLLVLTVCVGVMHHFSRGVTPMLIAIAVAFVTSVVAAAAMYRFVEIPAGRLLRGRNQPSVTQTQDAQERIQPTG